MKTEQKSVIHVCGPRIYEFEGWLFEVHSYCGPWPMKKDGSLRDRAGRIFFKMYDRFNKLSSRKKNKYRVGGGCQCFNH